ncbi:translation elongation factor 4 [Mycoplasma sp. SG1]|uniref:translation elongation factor 4 n=1 Tax=Mycoplasma sp. SG1 TaxID=2810348 RepID=UPI002024D9E4|nr:translation elongation factor 4 [Mycoplasma sp. SG1]URM53096.1 translation elongation factor 4 [Mycoplasma sp. SG1]
MIKDKSKIRSFCIVAHIDHGKSTLADRILEITNPSLKKVLATKHQLLDELSLEQERGITIKMNMVQLEYVFENETYFFQLIDTPGHVDFNYEVERSLFVSQGVLLLIDVKQGIQAQTISNFNLVKKHNLKIIPVLNKIDIQNINIEHVEDQVEKILGINRNEIVKISAKTGQGVTELLETIIKKLPAPDADDKKDLKALVFDSYYDQHRGIILLIYIQNGVIKEKDDLYLVGKKLNFLVKHIGIKIPKEVKKKELSAGEIGWLETRIKNTNSIEIGDTIVHSNQEDKTELLPYRKLKPMVFMGIYPLNADEYDKLKKSLAKLNLNDSSFVYVPESSEILGYGFRCGFLGILHAEIITQRLEREENISTVSSFPNVIYKITNSNNEVNFIENCSKIFPNKVLKIEEPFVRLKIITPLQYYGTITTYLIKKLDAVFIKNKLLDENYQEITFELSYANVIIDLYDQLKSMTEGYATMDYEILDYRENNLTRVDILLNKNPVDFLSFVCPKSKAYEKGASLCLKLKNVIPRKNFEIAIQAAIGSKILARETIKAYRKDVTAGLYGGDVTRKKKLLEKQSKGKKKMKKIGKIEVSTDFFINIFSHFKQKH